MPVHLEQLLELHRLRGAEVLVDAGAYRLAAGEQWCRVRKISPGARFPITVELGGHGAATFRLEELRGAREASGHAAV